MSPPTPTNRAVVVRPAQAADATAIAAIYNHYIGLGNCTMDGISWSPQDVCEYLGALAAREALLVADDGEHVVGWGIVRSYSPRFGYRTSCETSLYVDPAQQSCGLGQKIMDALLQECQRLEYHHIVVKIFADNDGSIRFHRRNGFTEVGIQHEIGNLRGTWLNVMVMQRLIPLSKNDNQDDVTAARGPSSTP